MNTLGWLQIALYLIILTLLTKPVGIFLTQVYNGEKTFLSFALRPVENSIYKLTGVNKSEEMNWREYGAAMLLFSFASMFALYLILRLQGIDFLNPQKFAALSEHLSFNTAISFTTNTNWQSYGGETTMSYFSQMVGLAYHNFVSAAVGTSISGSSS